MEKIMGRLKIEVPITNKLPCPKCGGSLMPNKETQGRTCFNCGFELRGTMELSKFLHANGREISADYQQNGLKYTTSKWGISNKALYNLPEIKILRSRMKANQRMPIYLDDDHNGHLPSLPQFSDNWTPEVQLKWLDIYKMVFEKEMVSAKEIN